MKHLYGEFSENQIVETKKSLRSSIFFLLLCADPETAYLHKDVDISKAFD